METPTRSPYVIAIGLALLFTLSALLYKTYSTSVPVSTRTVPLIEEPGTAHTHTSLLIMNRNTVINFCNSRYMLRSPAVHFEDNDCFVVHKHSVGVTLPTFLKTIGVTLSPSCMSILDEGKYCTNATDVLRVILNGKEISIEDLAYYELQNNDHILVNYGPEKDALLQLKYNQVPPIPLEVNEPLPIAL